MRTVFLVRKGVAPAAMPDIFLREHKKSGFGDSPDCYLLTQSGGLPPTSKMNVPPEAARSFFVRWDHRALLASFDNYPFSRF